MVDLFTYIATSCILIGDRVFLEGGKIKDKASIKIRCSNWLANDNLLVYLILFLMVVGQMKVHRC